MLNYIPCRISLKHCLRDVSIKYCQSLNLNKPKQRGSGLPQLQYEIQYNHIVRKNVLCPVNSDTGYFTKRFSWSINQRGCSTLHFNITKYNCIFTLKSLRNSYFVWLDREIFLVLCDMSILKNEKKRYFYTYPIQVLTSAIIFVIYYDFLFFYLIVCI